LWIWKTPKCKLPPKDELECKQNKQIFEEFERSGNISKPKNLLVDGNLSP
jgi:hypothetical protein